jgi:hypothetical protein
VLQREGRVTEKADVHQRSSPVSLDRMSSGQFEADCHAHQHAQAGLLRDERADHPQALLVLDRGGLAELRSWALLNQPPRRAPR